jgi:hypothetical protein
MAVAVLDPIPGIGSGRNRVTEIEVSIVIERFPDR